MLLAFDAMLRIPLASQAQLGNAPQANPETRSLGESLLSAAISGLLCLGGAGCASQKPGAAQTVGDASVGMITSSKVDENMTLAKFTQVCDARHGTIELHSHCGGMNSCKGMSYDTATQILTEHTCRALNTCAGYSCVVPG
jgi:hypothetical protein